MNAGFFLASETDKKHVTSYYQFLYEFYQRYEQLSTVAGSRLHIKPLTSEGLFDCEEGE
jgi:hypothetical protein